MRGTPQKLMIRVGIVLAVLLLIGLPVVLSIISKIQTVEAQQCVDPSLVWISPIYDSVNTWSLGNRNYCSIGLWEKGGWDNFDCHVYQSGAEWFLRIRARTAATGGRCRANCF